MTSILSVIMAIVSVQVLFVTIQVYKLNKKLDDIENKINEK